MLINDLPDDCLLKIFDYVGQAYLEDVVQLSKVCLRWHNLIAYRLTRIKYLLDYKSLKFDYNIKHSNTLYMRDSTIINEMDVNELLPNLKIFEASYLSNGKCKRILDSNPTIKGILDRDLQYEGHRKQVAIEKIEWLFVETLFPLFRSIHRPVMVTQLYVSVLARPSQLELLSLNSNLLRLHINILKNAKSGRLTFPNLKILEIHFDSFDRIDFSAGLLLIDGCPSLESAYIVHHYDCPDINVHHKNLNLRNLVLLIFYDEKWSVLRNFLSKYPKLENFALRYNKMIKDENVEKLITLLPRLKLMDFRGSPGVTGKAVEYVQKFNKKSGRSIVLYYDSGQDEPSDWPKYRSSYEPVCSGFDFMKHCFYKDFHQLPYILDF